MQARGMCCSGGEHQQACPRQPEYIEYAPYTYVSPAAWENQQFLVITVVGRGEHTGHGAYLRLKQCH